MRYFGAPGLSAKDGPQTAPCGHGADMKRHAYPSYSELIGITDY